MNKLLLSLSLLLATTLHAQNIDASRIRNFTLANITQGLAEQNSKPFFNGTAWKNTLAAQKPALVFDGDSLSGTSGSGLKYNEYMALSGYTVSMVLLQNRLVMLPTTGPCGLPGFTLMA